MAYIQGGGGLIIGISEYICYGPITGGGVYTEILWYILKGAWSRGFRRFLVKAVPKLSVANFIHA